MLKNLSLLAMGIGMCQVVFAQGIYLDEVPTADELEKVFQDEAKWPVGVAKADADKFQGAVSRRPDDRTFIPNWAKQDWPAAAAPAATETAAESTPRPRIKVDPAVKTEKHRV